MFKNWSADDWINHILFVVTILLLLASFLLA
jgi:hypothetical protein